MIDQRGRLLMAALGFGGCSIPSYDRALHALRIWLDSWSGIGHVAVPMAREGYDLQLTRYDERGWRATFYTTGMEHSPTSATGTGWKRTPWHATQRAAWEALRRQKRANWERSHPVLARTPTPDNTVGGSGKSFVAQVSRHESQNQPPAPAHSVAPTHCTTRTPRHIQVRPMWRRVVEMAAFHPGSLLAPSPGGEARRAMTVSQGWLAAARSSPARSRCGSEQGNDRL